MMRTGLLGAGAVALGFTVMGGSGGAIAEATPAAAPFSGTLHCAATGSLKFNAKLTNGGLSPSTITLRASLSGCTGTGTTNGGVSLSGGKLLATTTAPVASNCGAVLGGEALPNLTGSIKWKTTGGRAVDSAVTVSGAAVYYNATFNTITAYLPTTVSGGSFVGQPTAFAGLGSNLSAYRLTASCGAAGLGSLKFGNPGLVTGSMNVGA